MVSIILIRQAINLTDGNQIVRVDIVEDTNFIAIDYISYEEAARRYSTYTTLDGRSDGAIGARIE